MTVTIEASLAGRMQESAVLRGFLDHPFFQRVEREPLPKADVGMFLGQWWHALHYFTTFLARCVAVLPDMESKSSIAHILNQEAGGGVPARAHEAIFVDTMVRVGFDEDEVVAATPFPETTAVVEGYERASGDRLSALGFIFATEVTDLTMVSGIGRAVTGLTGATDLEWVRIHVAQEPDHVADAGQALFGNFTEEEAAVVEGSADEMWALWTGFFDRLEHETGRTGPQER